MIWALHLAIALLGLITYFAYREQGRRYEQLIRILENDRDAARAESKTYRNLLFPLMAKTEAAHEAPNGANAAPASEPVKVGKLPAAPPVPPEPKTVDDIWKMRIPYRQKFKLLLKLNNTKQRNHDALVSALESQKPVPQEKENVTTT